MRQRFTDRGDAGRQLAERLDRYHGRPKLLVLGLPRGGIPVAAEVADALHAPLDLLAVRKLGAPGRPELAMGAVAGDGIVVLQPEVIRALGITDAEVAATLRVERAELHRREAAYRGARPFPDLRGVTVILVDDGVATGATMVAAVRALRTRAPARIVAAAPVMSVEASAALGREADDVVAIEIPADFLAVGAWYSDFRQTTDAEVLELLARGRHAGAGRVPAFADVPR